MRIWSVLLVLYVGQRLNCLCGVLFTSGYFYSEGCLIVFRRAWKVFRKFCPLCYKQVIALSPRRIKNKCSHVFSKFSQIALVAAQLRQFCEDFENTRENLFLILLGLTRLHILIAQVIIRANAFSFFFSPETSKIARGHFEN